MASKPRPSRYLAAAFATTYREYPELRKLPAAASKTAFTISNLPELRPLELRKGAQLGHALKNRARPFNLEVCLAYMRGELVQPCQHCVRFAGPHVKCVVLAGFFKGSCTSCQYNDNGKKCSLRGRKPRPYTVVDDVIIYPKDDDFYVPDEDSDTPSANASVSLIQNSSHPRIPTGPSLSKKIGHDTRVEFGIRGAATSPRSNAAQQNSPQESGYDGRRYEEDFLRSRPGGQSSRDLALERIANAFHQPPSNRASDPDRWEPLYRDDEYDVRPIDRSSTLANRDLRYSLPPGREHYRRGRSHSPPPLISRIEPRYQPFPHDYGYDNDPNHYDHDSNRYDHERTRFSPPRDIRENRNEESVRRGHENREDRYFSSRNTRTEQECFREVRMTNDRKPEEYAPPLERRITQKPLSSVENDEQRRNGLNPSWPEIDPPHKPRNPITGKRDSTTAFGTTESMPPSKKKVQFAPATSSGSTAGPKFTPSANAAPNILPTGPRSMANANNSGVPTGLRGANNAGANLSRGPTVSSNETGTEVHIQSPTAPQKPQTSGQNNTKDSQLIVLTTASALSGGAHNIGNSTHSNVEWIGNKPSQAAVVDEEVSTETTLAPNSKDHIIARSMAMQTPSEDFNSIIVDQPLSTKASVEQIPQSGRLRVSGALDNGEGEPLNTIEKRKRTPPETSQATGSKAVVWGTPQQPKRTQPTAATTETPVTPWDILEPPTKRRKTPSAGTSETPPAEKPPGQQSEKSGGIPKESLLVDTKDAGTGILITESSDSSSKKPAVQKVTGQQSEKTVSVTRGSLFDNQKDAVTGIRMTESNYLSSEKPLGTTPVTEIKNSSGHQKKTPSKRSADNVAVPKKLLKQPLMEVGTDRSPSEVEKSSNKNTPTVAKSTKAQKKGTPLVKRATPTSNSSANDAARSPIQKHTQQSTSTQTEQVVGTPPISPPSLSEISISIQIQTAASQRLPFDERHRVLLAEAVGMTHAERETVLGDLAFRTSVFHEANSQALQASMAEKWR